MARQQGWFALVLALAISAAALLFTTPLQLGLDLRGGSQITVEVQPAGDIKRVGAEQMEAVKVVLDRRVNGLGVAESTLQTVGENQLVLQLPGEQDPTAAARILGDTALLEFRAQKPGTEADFRALRQLRSQAEAILNLREEQIRRGEETDPLDLERLGEAQSVLGLDGDMGSEEDQLRALLVKVDAEILKLLEPAALTGKQLVSAGRQPLQNNPNSWEVTLNFNGEGAEAFAELTKSIAGTDQLLSIVLDDQLISAATVGPQFKTAGISGGAATISGNFSAETARELEVKLRGGSLPLPVEVIEVRTIGPTLGAENIRRSLVAALSGLALVAVCIILVMRLQHGSRSCATITPATSANWSARTSTRPSSAPATPSPASTTSSDPGAKISADRRQASTARVAVSAASTDPASLMASSKAAHTPSGCGPPSPATCIWGQARRARRARVRALLQRVPARRHARAQCRDPRALPYQVLATYGEAVDRECAAGRKS